MSSSGMAAQLTRMKGSPRAVREVVQASATSSLPVPDSPRTSTVASRRRHPGDLLAQAPIEQALAEQRRRLGSSLLLRASRPWATAPFTAKQVRPVGWFGQIGGGTGVQTLLAL